MRDPIGGGKFRVQCNPRLSQVEAHLAACTLACAFPRELELSPTRSLRCLIIMGNQLLRYVSESSEDYILL